MTVLPGVLYKWLALRWMSLCICTHSKAQFREDCRLQQLLLSAQSPSLGGTFRGARSALDGVTGSNTYALEKCLNWRGLLIEASPESYAKLQVSGRKAAKVHTLQCALRKYSSI